MYKKKLDLMIEVGRQIRNARAALEYQVGDLRPMRSGAKLNPVKLIFDNKIEFLDGPKSREVRTKFKKVYDVLNQRDSELEEGVRLLRAEIESLEAGRRTPTISAAMEASLRMLKKDFTFSDDPLNFGAELNSLTLFFASSKGECQGVNILADKALFHAGKVLGHLEARGREESDKQGRPGSIAHKGYIPHDEILREAEKASKKIKGDRTIARVVKQCLEKREEDKKNPRQIYSEDRIRKIWLEHKRKKSTNK